MVVVGSGNLLKGVRRGTPRVSRRLISWGEGLVFHPYSGSGSVNISE